MAPVIRSHQNLRRVSTCPSSVFERHLGRLKLLGEMGHGTEIHARAILIRVLFLVSPRLQSRYPQARMALVADVEPDQHRGDLLNDAGILQLSAIESAHSWN